MKEYVENIKKYEKILGKYMWKISLKECEGI